MNNRSVEMYLRKMIEIDQEALAVEGQIKEAEELRQKELRKAKRSLEMEVLKRARMEARKEMEENINEARNVEAVVLTKTEEELAVLSTAYAGSEESLVRKIFQSLMAEDVRTSD